MDVEKLHDNTLVLGPVRIVCESPRKMLEYRAYIRCLHSCLP